VDGKPLTIGVQPNDWRDSRLVLRLSSIHGKGHFASQPFKAGEVVWVFGGTLFSREDIVAGRANERTLMRLDKNLWIGSTTEKPLDDDYYLNHSCDPNLWITDAIKLTARRDIAAGEEVTMDYATHFDDPSWTMKNRCNCGSRSCRGTITGSDWMRKDLQEMYRGHFTPFLNTRISQIVLSN
jgi:uncharacterized protein